MTFLVPDCGAVPADDNVDLGVRGRALGEAPLAAWAPVAQGEPPVELARLASGRHDLEARLERAVRWRVHRHRQVHDGHTAQHSDQLAHADGRADAFVLLRNDLGFPLLPPHRPHLALLFLWNVKTKLWQKIYCVQTTPQKHPGQSNIDFGRQFWDKIEQKLGMCKNHGITTKFRDP